MAEHHSPDTILNRALQTLDLRLREAYLDEACGGDEQLRKEVDSLLVASLAAERFMETAGELNILPQTEKEGDWIGRYRLLELVGEGGFGRVWMAEQREPMERRVALKIVKLGMDTGQVVARFEAERQALAMMDHPNIAHVHDGGATESGRPFFVMELVRGVPITTHCDANKQTPRERIDLFRKVCEAVQHAHQKGIIHRDLKPSNILVTVQDDKPVPKVIDFGVAKALQKRLTERTLFTRIAQWIGTPEYMSPEQAGLGSHDVDTRSDVYSLGVILYELLTGRTPFGARALREEGYEAILRTIREEDPPKPSTRLSSLSEEELSSVADHRGESPEKLGREVRGELDWILLKALNRDRTRRYESASQLSEELQRFSAHEPISAVPPSMTYQIGKFLRRRRQNLAVAGAIAVLGALSAWLALRPRPPQELPPYVRTGDPLLATIEAHEGRVADLAYSPGKEILASSGWDGTIKLWRASSGEQLATLSGHTIAQRDLAFTPDGETLISTGIDGKILIWDVGSRIILRTVAGRVPPSKLSHGSTKLCVSPDGGTFATGHGGVIELRSVHTGDLVTTIDIGFDPQGGIALGPNGRYLAFASGDKPGLLTLWDLQAGRNVWTRKADGHSALDIAFSPDGSLLGTGNADHWVRVWDVETGDVHMQSSVHPSWVNGVAFSPNGELVASCGHASVIKLAELRSGSVLATLPGHGRGIPTHSPIFLAGGASLATCGTDGRIRIWDVEAVTRVVAIKREKRIAAMIEDLEAARKELSAGIRPSETVRGRYVKLISDHAAGTTNACIAELQFMDGKGTIVPQGELSAHGCSSFQPVAPMANWPVNNARVPDNVIDGDPATYWHSRWFPKSGEPFPHWIVIDLGKSREIGGFFLRNRGDGKRHLDTLKWRLYMSNDAENWEGVANGGFESSPDWQGYVFGQVEKTKMELGSAIAYDGFDGELSLDWEVINSDPSHVSFTKKPGTLTITTQEGGIVNANTGARNIFLIRNPVGEGGDFTITTCLVSFQPGGKWNQAGLLCFQDQDNYLKYGIEVGATTGGCQLARVAEENGVKKTGVAVPFEEGVERLWLRVTKTGSRYTQSISTDGTTFQKIGDIVWRNGTPGKLGLIAKNGTLSSAPEIDASFDYFEVRSPKPAELLKQPMK